MPTDYQIVQNTVGRYLIQNIKTGYYIRRADLTYASFATTEEAQEYLKHYLEVPSRY